MTEHDRTEVLKFAEAHGTAKAAERFEVNAGTIRSWRSRERSSDPTIKPGNASYRVAELPSRFGDEAPASGADTIVTALEVAARDGLDMARQHVWIPSKVIAAWLARDDGREPQVAPDDAFQRMRHAFAGLPDDVRCAMAAEVERAAWAYHAPDLEHVRILRRREDEAAAERRAQEQAERDERERERKAEAERRAAESKRLAAERERAWQARAEEEERQREASEAARRSSEALRRSTQAEQVARAEREVASAAERVALQRSPVG